MLLFKIRVRTGARTNLVNLILSHLVGFEDLAPGKTDRTWLWASVTLVPKVAESCSKAQKTRQVF